MQCNERVRKINKSSSYPFHYNCWEAVRVLNWDIPGILENFRVAHWHGVVVPYRVHCKLMHLTLGGHCNY